MTYQNFNRAQVDRAEPLEFARPPRTTQAEKPIEIRITVAPDGLSISASYTGTLSSIPDAIERLRTSGVLDLVKAAPIAQPKPKRTKIEPMYNGAGEPCCPVHTRPLKEGQHGLYCSSKAKPGEQADPKGYCGLKFS